MQINRKRIILISVLVLLALLLGGAYIWYTNNYGNMKKVTLESNAPLDYEWQTIASSSGITCDYLWARTKELMLTGAEDGTLIPSNLTIAGRLVTEPQEESGVYLLSDQALLLDAYVKRGDRFAASSLVTRVNEQFDFALESNYEKSCWLMAFLNYYEAYGKTSDYSKIEELTSLIFDSEGNMLPESLSVAAYNDNDYISIDITDEDGESTLGSIPGEESSASYRFNGVTLSSINLRLIKALEDNELLPAGSYEKNLGLVLGGVVSENIPLFSYAYEILDDGTVSYINSHKYAASVDVYEAIVTMRNLSEVGELSVSSYLWAKNLVINGQRISESYFFVTGQLGGSEVTEAYTELLHIAVNMDDQDLFQRVIITFGNRVATYNNSPALSMVYRSHEDRYTFYARENLELALILL